MEHNTSRYQRGFLYRSQYKTKDGQTVYGAWNVKYRVTENGKRVLRSKWLCDGDTSKSAARRLADEHMVTINAQAVPGENKPTDQTPITEYWERVYLPTVKKGLKPSSVYGYQQIWQQFLKEHFTERTFQAYETHHGSKLLNDLVAEGYGRRTVAHVRSLASGIFTHAINDGVLTQNPWHDVKTKIKPPRPKDGADYTLTELMDIVNNKLTRVDAQLIVCLAGLMGLRPSEIVGLCWEDVNLKAGRLRLHQAYVRGHLGTTKTDIDVKLPMLKTVIGRFKAWHQQCGEPSNGWVFANQSGDPINIRDYVIEVLRPAVGMKEWKGLYAFRRGAGTIVTEITGNPIAAQQLLCHLDLSTTMRHYIKSKRSALDEGIQMLDAYSGRSRSAFRGDVDHDSGLKPISVPG